MSSVKVSAILLAAGLSRRMGEDKLLLTYRESTLLQRSVNLMSKLPVYERILVTTETRLESVTLPIGIKACINCFPEHGLSSSVRIGVEEATGTHYLFLVADQPKLDLIDILQILKSINDNPDKIIFPVIDSKPGSPTVFPAVTRPELLKVTGDEGGRTIRDAHPELCFAIEPEHPKHFIDIDSFEDYTNLN